jgi:hypothetical protein
MFLLRSAFWLGVGFLVVKPFALDAQTTNAIADEMLDSGRQIAIEQTQSFDCKDITCATVKTAALVSLQNASAPKIKEIAKASPTPPARPAWAN